jgi:AbrB family looped-hinge helix DNA binding protein
MSIQAKVTTKGQITLPKAIRESLSIRTGDRVEFSVDQANQVSIHRMQSRGSSAGCAKHFLKPGHQPLSHEAEKAALGDALRAQYSARSKPGK